MGRCNTSVEFLSWCFKVQCFSWPLIELAGDFVELGLGELRQVGAFWKVLAQQAIGVFVRSPLPGALRITEVDVDIGFQCEPLTVSQAAQLLRNAGTYLV